MIRLFLLLALLGCGCTWFGSNPVVPSDGSETDDPAGESDTTEAPEDPVSDPPPDTADPTEDTGDATEETGPQACGNGTVEPPETCDDGNTVTEYCGRGSDCLADCSLFQGMCGNSETDPGESCDDGNDDSMDACTTSCTLNNRSVGSPCRCTGSECSTFDFTAGTIEGCDNVPEMDTEIGALACLRSMSLEPYSTEAVFFPEGYCSLLALECEGSLCILINSVGNVEAFHCPDPYVTQTIIYSVTDTEIRFRVCLEACESPADCRWNAEEDSGACGEMGCLPHTDAPLLGVCKDARNFF